MVRKPAASISTVAEAVGKSAAVKGDGAVGGEPPKSTSTAPSASPRKREKEDDDHEVVPIKKPRESPLDAELKTGMAMPSVPQNYSTDEAWSVMKNVIPWVKHSLAQSPVVTACGSKKLHEHEPLEIKSNVVGEEMASFQAPWDSVQCNKSLRSTMLYQAGANLLWVQASPHGSCPSPSLCWAQVRNIQDAFFHPRGENAKLTTDGRIIFPVILHAYVTEIGQLAGAASAGETALPLLGGQGLVMAWYAAVFDALVINSVQQLASLWQCALTMIVQLRLLADMTQVIANSIQVSEGMYVTAKHLSDTFVCFTEKLSKCNVPLEIGNLKQFKALGLRFNGAAMNKTMLVAASLVVTRVSASCRSVLSAIDFKHGRDVFSTGYNKILRVIQIAEKCCEQLHFGAEDAVRFFFCAARRMLDEDPKSAKQFTIENLDNRRGVGLVATVLGRQWVVDFCVELVKDLASIDKPPMIVGELQGVLNMFSDFDAFEKEFLLSTEFGKSVGDCDNEEETLACDGEEVDDDKVEKKKNT